MASVSETQTPLFIPEEWCDAADTIAYDSITSPPPIAFICGAKNSGKTTFSRYLLNVLLKRYKKVGYLDTDVGQAEFTPPGCLSLTVIDEITPDLAIPCLKTPERCFFFGDISSKRDPTSYVTYIFALYDYYQKELCTSDKSGSPGNTGLPLVINTPGWVKGIGYDMLVDMLKYISPSHVVKTCISAESKNLPAGAFWLDQEVDAAVTLIEVNSARQDSFKRVVLAQKDARLLRDLRMIAYFRQCFPSDLDILTIKRLADALAAHPPYEIPMSRIKIKHLHCQVPSAELFCSLNATIVGLAVSSGDPEHLPSCVGLGIVRGIDTFKRLLSIITPVPPNTLEKVDLLLQGFIKIPDCLSQVQEYVSPLPTN
ncbi:polynucleotide 5'-hydroxyl-kinase NOL9-like [Cornus florida]|uniref:polynucleotide 5'-hydroxyl-kinase NOL9-like n=1 Tax=Cornus florida TaxID=4283 RepID=UPI00289C7847|nr:polynucleotide 5'-hydroxyl-kinase NOL9-like [Cornus florida]